MVIVVWCGCSEGVLLQWCGVVAVVWCGYGGMVWLQWYGVVVVRVLLQWCGVDVSDRLQCTPPLPGSG